MTEPRQYLCYRADSTLNLTGALDKPFWRYAPWTDNFVDIEGDRRPAPRFRTRAKMLWDDDYLYVGAEMEEPHVWATLTEHDAIIFYDNDFEVFIDPDGDNHDYYELEINANGTTWDLRLVKPYRDGGPALNSWEIPGLRSAVRIDGTLNDPSDADRGWSVELAFPWKALGEYARCPAPPRADDQWRMNFSRVEWDIEIVDGQYRKVPGRAEHNWVWTPQAAVDMHRPETWGFVQFTEAPPGTAKFRQDISAPARDCLMRVYHAQKAFYTTHGRWAAMTELGPASSDGVEMRLTPDGFTAHIELAVSDGAPVRWSVRQDSLLWSGDR